MAFSRIGVVTFSSIINTEIYLNRFSDVDELTNEVFNLPHLNVSSYIGCIAITNITYTLLYRYKSIILSILCGMPFYVRSGGFHGNFL